MLDHRQASRGVRIALCRTWKSQLWMGRRMSVRGFRGLFGRGSLRHRRNLFTGPCVSLDDIHQHCVSPARQSRCQIVIICPPYVATKSFPIQDGREEKVDALLTRPVSRLIPTFQASGAPWALMLLTSAQGLIRCRWHLEPVEFSNLFRSETADSICNPELPRSPLLLGGLMAHSTRTL